MLLTEEEYRTKWCPASRFGDDGPCGNRWDMAPGASDKWGTSSNPTACRCIASECAWWRWGVERRLTPSSDPQAETGVEYVQSDKGYCGQAGRP